MTIQCPLCKRTGEPVIYNHSLEFGKYIYCGYCNALYFRRNTALSVYQKLAMSCDSEARQRFQRLIDCTNAAAAPPYWWLGSTKDLV